MLVQPAFGIAMACLSLLVLIVLFVLAVRRPR